MLVYKNSWLIKLNFFLMVFYLRLTFVIQITMKKRIPKYTRLNFLPFKKIVLGTKTSSLLFFWSNHIQSKTNCKNVDYDSLYEWKSKLVMPLT